MDVIETHLSSDTAIETNTKSLQETVYNVVNEFLTTNKGKPINNLYDLLLQEIEPPLLQLVMEKNRGNQLQAAKVLGISRGTIRKKLMRYFGTRFFRLTD